MTRLTIVCISFIIISLMLAGVSNAKIDPETIVGMWLFDEGSGNVAKDSSENGNDAELIDGPKWVSGQFGKALSLDGTDDYVSIAHDDSLMVGDGHTITLWIKFETVPTTGMAVVTKDDWGPGFWLDGSIIRHHTHDPPGTLHYIDAPWTPDTKWHNIALTWDGKQFEIYLDAVGIADGVTAENLGRAGLTDKPLLIGIYIATAEHGNWGAFLPGIIDEVAIFNTALTNDDIKTIMKGLKMVTSIEPSGKISTTWADIKK